jgi:hypothetical protein
MYLNRRKLIFFFVYFIVAFCRIPVYAGGWPEVFEPTVLRTLYLEMNSADWQIIENDLTFDIEVPAWFWAEGEQAYKLFVSVRRKSGDPIPPADGIGGPKISLKIDINEYVGGQEWHGINKLSLENGDDNNVLTEGLACNLHQMASGPEGYGYDAWRGNWIKLYVNGHYYGVYFNAEQLDKRFLENRGIYVRHQTWLYQYRGAYNYTLEVGDDLNPRSPAVNELCYRPFRNESDPLLKPDVFCDPPSGMELVEQLDNWIDMRGMLAMAAVNAFVSNPDSLFTHERNSHFLDFSIADGRKRMYFPWDVDAANFRKSTTIFGSSTGYEQLILTVPVFRELYCWIICELIAGPLCEDSLLTFIDRIEPVLIQAVADDPYNQLGTNTLEGVAGYFDDIRQKLVDRVDSVRTQAECPACADANLDGCGFVNLADFALLANELMLSAPSLVGDINKDGTVDMIDLRIFTRFWLNFCQ